MGSQNPSPVGTAIGMGTNMLQGNSPFNSSSSSSSSASSPSSASQMFQPNAGAGAASQPQFQPLQMPQYSGGYAPQTMQSTQYPTMAPQGALQSPMLQPPTLPNQPGQLPLPQLQGALQRQPLQMPQFSMPQGQFGPEQMRQQMDDWRSRVMQSATPSGIGSFTNNTNPVQNQQFQDMLAKQQQAVQAARQQFEQNYAQDNNVVRPWQRGYFGS